MLGYLAWLVETGVFKKIVLGFLPVGCVSTAPPEGQLGADMCGRW